MFRGISVTLTERQFLSSRCWVLVGLASMESSCMSSVVKSAMNLFSEDELPVASISRARRASFRLKKVACTTLVGSGSFLLKILMSVSDEKWTKSLCTIALRF